MALINSFKDLNTWREAHKLAIKVYEVTNSFPSKETFSLIDQMRRCAVSISSNIAEGFSRQGVKEKLQFYHISKGSLTELHNQLLIAYDVAYLDSKQFTLLEEQIVVCGKLLTGLIKSIRR